MGEPSIAIVGGCGHVGLPLGIQTRLAGFPTTLIDVNARAVDAVRGGAYPFLEVGGEAKLQAALEQGLAVTTDPATAESADVIVFVTGTPVDEHLNPKISVVLDVMDQYARWLRPGDLVVMRSTLYPGSMALIESRLTEACPGVLLSYCPERVAQGHALEEIGSLPQIVSGCGEEAFQRAYAVFQRIAPRIVRLTTEEAEVAKLMANAWRYLEFAIPNQFYLLTESKGIDFYRVYDAIRFEYPRAATYSSPGFAAGPCLFKDTMQLACFADHQFTMGHQAMLVNEGLARFVVQKAETLLGSLRGRRVGILGLTFKANNDDVRESLSFRVKKNLEFLGSEVLCHDPYVEDAQPLEEVVENSEVLILCTPHREYEGLRFTQPVVDVWGRLTPRSVDVLPGTED